MSTTSSRDRLPIKRCILAKPIDTERKLVAIFAADVEGHSRLMGADEVAHLKRPSPLRREILDGLNRLSAAAASPTRLAIVCWPSLAARWMPSCCAMEAQAALATANSTLPPESRHINFRIGVHVGDVMVRAGDLFGDGVNITARLQVLARAGGRLHLRCDL